MSKAREFLAKANHSQNEVSKSVMKAMAHLERAKRLTSLGKSAAGASDEINYHMTQAHMYMTKAADMNDVLGYNLGKAITVWVGERGETPVDAEPGVYEPESGQELKPQADLTEGDVPGYPSDLPYRFGLPSDPGIPTRGGMKSAQGSMSKAQIDELIRAKEEAAFAKGQLEAVNKYRSNTPGGSPKGVVFGSANDVSKSLSGGEGNLSELLMAGVDLNGVNVDPNVNKRAAGKIITNMINNSGVFGKSLLDPSFKGKAVGGSVMPGRMR